MKKLSLIALLTLATLTHAQQSPTLDRKFAVLAGTAASLMVSDYELTQRCLKTFKCHESNPMLPHGHIGMYAAGASVNTGAFLLSYEMKKHHKRLWWVPIALVIAAHTEGVGSNIFLRVK